MELLRRGNVIFAPLKSMVKSYSMTYSEPVHIIGRNRIRIIIRLQIRGGARSKRRHKKKRNRLGETEPARTPRQKRRKKDLYKNYKSERLRNTGRVIENIKPLLNSEQLPLYFFSRDLQLDVARRGIRLEVKRNSPKNFLMPFSNRSTKDVKNI